MIGIDNFVSFSWLQLKTRQGTELLIQSENDAVVNEWYRALQDTISTHVSMNFSPGPKMSAAASVARLD